LGKTGQLHLTRTVGVEHMDWVSASAKALGFEKGLVKALGNCVNVPARFIAIKDIEPRFPDVCHDVSPLPTQSLERGLVPASNRKGSRVR